MTDTILVAYATRYGSTAEVAEAIGDELRKTGVEVDVQPIDDIQGLSRYQAVIIGSPIYMGKWLPEAQVFVERHQQYLRGIPVAYFAVGLTVAGETPDAIRKAEASMGQVSSRPRDHQTHQSEDWRLPRLGSRPGLGTDPAPEDCPGLTDRHLFFSGPGRDGVASSSSSRCTGATLRRSGDFNSSINIKKRLS